MGDRAGAGGQEVGVLHEEDQSQKSNKLSRVDYVIKVFTTLLFQIDTVS